MKEIVQILGRRYSSVSTNDNSRELHNLKSHNKSFHSNRKISQGFSIVDSFFNQREIGKRTRSPKRIFLLMASGLMAICAAIIMYLFPSYDIIFKWKVVFADGGEIFDLWAKPPVDLYLRVYLFNITNVEEFKAGKEKMKVKEVGPYVYREDLSHDNVTFNKNGTLTATPHHPLIWQEHLSEGNREDDLLMLPNIALLSIAQVASQRSYFFRLPVNVVIRQSEAQPVVEMTAKEFMFGYESTITTLGNTLMPDWIVFEKVGLIDRMYDFKGDVETVFTGETEPGMSGLLDTYRHSQHLDFWHGDHCSKIHMASDGTKFHSFIEPNDTLLFYRKSMCRPQRLIRSGDITEVSGMDAYKYVIEDNALDNGHFDPKNKCFCREGVCLPYGLIDVTDCYYGFPIALSYPHFLDADPKIIESIDGIDPKYEDHYSYFKINPISGLPLNLSVKFQINLYLNDISSMAHVEEFSNTVIPMLWFEMSMIELPEPLKNRFHLYLNVLPYLDPILMWCSAIGGAILLILAVSRAVYGVSSQVSKSQILSKHQKNLTIKRSTNVYAPCEERMIDDNNFIRIEDELCDIELADDNNYILEAEPAISDNDNDEGNSSLSDDQSTDGQSSVNGYTDLKISENNNLTNSSSGISSNWNYNSTRRRSSAISVDEILSNDFMAEDRTVFLEISEGDDGISTTLDAIAGN